MEVVVAGVVVVVAVVVVVVVVVVDVAVGNVVGVKSSSWLLQKMLKFLIWASAGW